MVLGVCVTPPVQSFRKDRLCVCNVPDTVTGAWEINDSQDPCPRRCLEFSGGDWLSSEMKNYSGNKCCME